jgi:hypothetical protein
MDTKDETDLEVTPEDLTSWLPLDRSRAMAYFERCHFFQSACFDANGLPVLVNNIEARKQGLDPAIPGVLE